MDWMETADGRRTEFKNWRMCHGATGGWTADGI